MDILILADFCGAMDGTGNNRFLYLADMLARNHEVELLTSDFCHGKKTYFSSVPQGFPFRVTMLHEGAYSKNVSLRRFHAHWIWGKNVRDYLERRKKPDVVYAAVPPLSAPFHAAKYCEKHGIRFIVDIQDLWPEAFQMVFRVPILSSLAFAPFRHLADGVYKRADHVVGVSETYVNRAVAAKGKCHSGTTVFLGTDMAVFDQNVRENPPMDGARKPDGEIWMAYCGTLGASYDLNVVFEAMRLLDAPNLRFVVMGDGERREEFQRNAQGLNTLFTGRLPYPKMCGTLATCDIVVNPIMPGAAQSIINKHADYAFSGLPVLNTQECPEYRKLVDSYHMGFNCRNNDPRDLAGRLRTLLDDPTLRSEMGRNARRCAEERFDRSQSYRRIVDLIEDRKGA